MGLPHPPPRARAHPPADAGTRGPSLRLAPPDPSDATGGGRASLQSFVHAAAAQITRLSPAEAAAAAATDALIVDIRSQDARERLGVIPGSLHIPRTVLEWRVALDSPWRNGHIGGLDHRLILICDHGYSSILAASNLVSLGFHRAGDVIGGFEAWRDGNLPVVPWHPRPVVAGAWPGTGPPD